MLKTIYSRLGQYLVVFQHLRACFMLSPLEIGIVSIKAARAKPKMFEAPLHFTVGGVEHGSSVRCSGNGRVAFLLNQVVG